MHGVSLALKASWVYYYSQRDLSIHRWGLKSGASGVYDLWRHELKAGFLRANVFSDRIIIYTVSRFGPQSSFNESHITSIANQML